MSPLWTPHSGDDRILTNAGIVGVGTAPGTNVGSNATTLLYGTTVELLSAANNLFDTYGIRIAIFETGASATASEASLDIMAGAATEDVIISSLLVGGAYTATAREYFFPLFIPGGTRISCRLASLRTSITAVVAIWMYGGKETTWRWGRRVTTYGTKINNARGVAVTPTASGGAASVTQVVASTTEDHFAFMPGLQIATDTAWVAGQAAVGVGLGAATEERIGTWWMTKSAAEHCTMFPAFCVERDVPSGTRLSLLVSEGTANESNYDGHVYAVSA